MKRLLITDLDGTLYDWIGFFIPAFYALVDELSSITGIDREVLLSEYKEKHQYYGNVEFPFVTLTLPSIKKKYPFLSEDELKKVLEKAFHCFNFVRKKKLKLYDGVEQTLKQLSEQGVLIIGYTESCPENGFYRLKKLNISNYFTKVYTATTKYQSLFPLDRKVQMVSTKKPDKKMLLEICQLEKCDKDDALYVGDSVTKDIYMAYSAGITSILINHPKKPNDYYQKLADITSWTEEDFLRETKLERECRDKNILPDITINHFQDVYTYVMKKW